MLNIPYDADDFILKNRAFLKNCFYILYKNEMIQISEKKCFLRKYCDRLDKITPETIKIMKDACKDKCVDESMIFRLYMALSAELATKPGRQESVVNDSNVKTVQAIFQENGLLA